MVAAFRERCPKPILVAWPLAIPAASASLQASGVHIFPEYSRAVRTMARIADYADCRTAPREPAPAADFDWSAHIRKPRFGQVIPEFACHMILAHGGLPVAPSSPATTEDAAAETARRLGVPVVMKGISEQVTHRAAAGLLVLGLRSESAVGCLA